MKLITDQLFNISEAANYTLLLELRPRMFSVAVFDRKRKRFIAFATSEAGNTSEQYYADFRRFLKNDIFDTAFSETRLLWVSQKSTLVPASLFVSDAVRTWFEFNHPLLDSEELNYNHIRYNDSFSVFSMPSEISSLAINRFKSVRFFNQSTALIESVLLSQKHKANKKKLFVNVEATFFDVLVIESDKLLLYNTFFYSNTSDFVYFILYVYESMRLNPQEHETTLLGQIDLQSELLQALRKYIKKLNFVTFRDEQSLFSHVFASISLYKHTNLFNLERCE